MRKFQDRITLGIISGLIGNIAKALVSEGFEAKNFVKVDSASNSGRFFIGPKKISKGKGKIIGVLADTSIAMVLGIIGTLILSSSGKDKYALKGIANGAFGWMALYGALGNMGINGNKKRSRSINDTLGNFVNYTVFGLVTSIAIVGLGDDSLFKPKYKTLSNPKNEEQKN